MGKLFTEASLSPILECVFYSGGISRALFGTSGKRNQTHY